jgi:hypothetical protein
MHNYDSNFLLNKSYTAIDSENNTKLLSAIDAKSFAESQGI